MFHPTYTPHTYNTFIWAECIASKQTDRPASTGTVAPDDVKGNRTISETEFVSDTFQTTEKDLEEVKAGMKRLGIDTLAAEKTEKPDGKIVCRNVPLTQESLTNRWH